MYRESNLIYIPTDKENEITLYDKIKEKQNKALIIKLTDKVLSISKYPTYVAQSPNTTISRYLKKDFIKGIITELIKNGGIKNQSIEPPKKTIKTENSNTLEISRDNSLLKILLLGKLHGLNKPEQLTGLNVEYQESSMTSFSKYIRDKLGQYDIIINDGLFIGNVASMAEESLEQCKITGRQLTVLVNYFINFIYNSENPNKIKRKTIVQIAISGTSVKSTKVKEYPFYIETEDIDSNLAAIYRNILNKAMQVYKTTAEEIIERKRREEKRKPFIDEINQILDISYTYLKIKGRNNNPYIEVKRTNTGIEIKNWLDNNVISALTIEIIKGKSIKVTINASDPKISSKTNNTLFLSIDNEKEDIFPPKVLTDYISSTLSRMKTHIVPYINEERTMQLKREKRS